MKNSLKEKLLLLLFFVSGMVLAQNSITGKVVDVTGASVFGASVVVKPSSKGAMTNEDGQFTIENVANGNYTVEVSYIGYKTQSKAVTVNGKTVVNFTLAEDATMLEDVVVTGVVNPRGKLKSSVSVSSVGVKEIELAAPRATAEIFRSIPGIKSESTGGEGNANITVRGVPVASGGGKFLQIQEDGMPVMQFGDVAFGNTDIFIRNDQTIAKIEAIRGGSASTMASNSPAGIINFVSKDGKVEGGSLMQSFGLDFNNMRTDFEYGSPLGNGLRFHVGGFYRQGEGPRNIGYNGNLGGQLKMNITKEFEKGYVRLYFKHLNDRAVGYLPMPARVTGTNDNPTWGSVANFDLLRDSQHSALFLDNLTIGPDGERRRSNIADGMRPMATSFGADLVFDLGDDWKLEERFRQNFHAGRFVSPFPAEIASASAMAASFNDPSLTGLTYANGPLAGNPLNPNQLVMRIHLFDTEINNFNNFSNDVKLSKKFDQLSATLGYYRAFQNINMSWLWNSYLLDVNGNNAALVNAGNNSTNGLYAYGVPFWGNCCTRNYDATYDISAPYVAAEFNPTDDLSIEASVRFDNTRARGTYAAATQSANLDVNNDGVISLNEQSVSVVDNANRLPINYDVNYVSYSVGANYLLNENQSVFARHSRGGRANADRLLFGPSILPSGAALNGLSADMVTQTEAGFKHRKGNLGLYATFFIANASEQNWDFAGSAPREIQREYQAKGIELETTYKWNKFDFSGSVTWTDAQIKRDALDPSVEGNTPRRQADFIYNGLVSYKIGSQNKGNVGFSFVGTTKSFAQDNNALIMPGYVYVNPFVSYEIANGLTASINVNNVFNTIGITEVEEGSITPNVDNIVRARSINGRTTALTFVYRF